MKKWKQKSLRKNNKKSNNQGRPASSKELIWGAHGVMGAAVLLACMKKTSMKKMTFYLKMTTAKQQWNLDLQRRPNGASNDHTRCITGKRTVCDGSTVVRAAVMFSFPKKTSPENRLFQKKMSTPNPQHWPVWTNGQAPPRALHRINLSGLQTSTG